MELADVLGRPKLDRYVTIRERREFLRLFNRIVERIPITRVIQVCSDQRTISFLGLPSTARQD
jgi:predicted nucleic acid-binding protein